MAHLRPTRQRTAVAITAFSVLMIASVTMPALATSVAHASANYAATVLADGPVSYWRLGELSGTTATDSGAGGNTGTYNTGTTLGVPGAITSDTNTATQFNGTQGYVSVPDNANLDITGNMTLEMLAKPGLLNGTTQTVLQKGTSASAAGAGWQYRVSVTSANRWKAILFVGATSFELTDNIDTLSTSRWDYLVVVRNGSTVTFYVDGQSVASTAISGATNTTTGMLAFGRAGGYSNYYYNGSIDEVAVYNVALSSSQIVNHYHRREQCGLLKSHGHGDLTGDGHLHPYRYVSGHANGHGDCDGNCHRDGNRNCNDDLNAIISRRNGGGGYRVRSYGQFLQ